MSYISVLLPIPQRVLASALIATFPESSNLET